MGFCLFFFWLVVVEVVASAAAYKLFLSIVYEKYLSPCVFWLFWEGKKSSRCDICILYPIRWVICSLRKGNFLLQPYCPPTDSKSLPGFHLCLSFFHSFSCVYTRCHDFIFQGKTGQNKSTSYLNCSYQTFFVVEKLIQSLTHITDKICFFQKWKKLIYLLFCDCLLYQIMMKRQLGLPSIPRAPPPNLLR